MQPDARLIPASSEDAPLLFLFDIDGTLLLSGGAGTRVLNRVFFRHHGVDDAMKRVSPGGKTDPLIVGEMFVNSLGRAPSTAEYNQIMSDYEAELAAEMTSSPGFRLMPDVHDVLATLAQNPKVVLAIATGNSEAGARAKLHRAKLLDYFLNGGTFPSGGYGSDSSERHQLVAVAISRAQAASGLQFPPGRIVVVGDTLHDISAARQCGVNVIAVTTGGPSRVELETGLPDAIIDCLSELLNLPPWSFD